MNSFFLSLLFLLPICVFSQSDSSLSALYANDSIHLIDSGSISTNMGEYSPFYDIHYNELYFMRRTPGKFDYTIYKSKLTQKGWSQPEIASFSGTYRDAAPYISPDGNTVFFDSQRPSNELAKNSINIWYSKRQGRSWSSPQLVKAASINSKNESKAGSDEFGPAVDRDGNLYFYSFRSPFRGGAHYTTFPPTYNKVQINKKLPDPSANTFISYLYISPNGRFALLEGRAKNRRDTDIYYSCKTNQNEWTDSIPVETVNTSYGEGVPSLTADGKFMLFASSRPTASKLVSSSSLYIVRTAHLFDKCRKSFLDE